MEDKRVKRNWKFIWFLADIVFSVVLLALTIVYMHKVNTEARNNAKREFTGFISAWAEYIETTAEEYEILGSVTGRLYEEGMDFKSEAGQKWMSILFGKSNISHIYILEKNKAVFDEYGNTSEDFDVSFLDGVDGNKVLFIDAFGPNQEPSLVYVISRQNCRVLIQERLDAISQRFDSIGFEDYSFLAIADKEGNHIANFSDYKDTDSRFFDEKNLFSIIGKAEKDAKEASLFTSRYLEGFDAAATINYYEDKRMLVSVNIDNTDYHLVFGLRYDKAEEIIRGNYQGSKAVFIKIAIVIVLFAAFAIVSIVYSNVSSRENDKKPEVRKISDSESDMYNKNSTENRIREYLATAPGSRAMFCVLDVDNFKKVNDTMGHAFGDMLLKSIGEQIKYEFRSTDIVGRTAGDEFIIFLKDIKDDSVMTNEVERINRFFQDFKAGGDYVKYSATASIGVALYPSDGKKYEDLYIAADQALYRAKKLGKNQLCFYSDQA